MEKGGNSSEGVGAVVIEGGGDAPAPRTGRTPHAVDVGVSNTPAPREW